MLVSTTGDFVTADPVNSTYVTEIARGSERGDSDVIRTLIWVNHVFEVVIALLCMLGNGLVLAAIARERSLQTITNYFVASLAAADFLVGVIGIPAALLGFNGIPDNFYGCLLMNSMIVILTQISIFALLLIALERFVAIKFPFRYHEKCTGRLALGLIVVSWIAGVLVGFLPALGWNLQRRYGGQCTFTAVISMEYMVYFNFLACVLTPLIIMALIYCYIFHIVKSAARQIEALQVSSVPAAEEEEIPQARKGFSLKKEAKAAMWFALVLLLFSVCWLPLHIQNMITLFSGKIHLPTLTAAILLSHLNSALNPILYAFANSKFKAGFKNIFGCPSNTQPDTTDVNIDTNNSQRVVTKY